MRRGELVIVAFQGDYGKPRPALVVQADTYAEYFSVTVAPLTSDRKGALFFRIDVPADPETGLQRPSQIMVDKLATYPTDKVGKVIGRVDPTVMETVDRSLLA